MSEFIDIAFTPSEEAAICLKCKLPSCSPSRCKDWEELKKLHKHGKRRTIKYAHRRESGA